MVNAILKGNQVRFPFFFSEKFVCQNHMHQIKFQYGLPFLIPIPITEPLSHSFKTSLLLPTNISCFFSLCPQFLFFSIQSTTIYNPFHQLPFFPPSTQFFPLKSIYKLHFFLVSDPTFQLPRRNLLSSYSFFTCPFPSRSRNLAFFAPHLNIDVAGEERRHHPKIRN